MLPRFALLVLISSSCACGTGAASHQAPLYAERDADPVAPPAGSSREGGAQVVVLPPDSTTAQRFVSAWVTAVAQRQRLTLRTMMSPTLTRLHGGLSSNATLAQYLIARVDQHPSPLLRADDWVDLQSVRVRALHDHVHSTEDLPHLQASDVVVQVAVRGPGTQVFAEIVHNGELELVLRQERDATVLVGLW